MREQESYCYQICREVDENTLDEIMRLRKQYFYDDIYDERYWDGGIYGLLSKEIIFKSHNEDASSLFLLICDSRKNLVGYSRFSTSAKTIGTRNFAQIHIFICDRDLRGIHLNIVEKEVITKVKLGKFMLEKVLQKCNEMDCSGIFSEICIFPYPNIPSLILHRKMGFTSFLPLPAHFSNYKKGEVLFTTMGKMLVPGAGLDSFSASFV